jgi:hypothetical protein
MLFSLLPPQNKKACLILKKQAFRAPRETGEELFLRKPGNPFCRTRGFVPPSFPRFTFSETHNCVNHHKEQNVLLFQTRQKEARLSTKKDVLPRNMPAVCHENCSKKMLIFSFNLLRLSGKVFPWLSNLTPSDETVIRLEEKSTPCPFVI